MKSTIALGVVAALLHGSAYVLYNIQTQLGSSSPNPVSWSIWAFIAIVNALSFRSMSRDIVSSLQFFTGSVACLCTVVYALYLGRYAWPTIYEWCIFVTGLLASVIWWRLRTATAANMIILGVFIISFIPTIEGVWNVPHREAPIPWILWTAAFGVTIVTIITRKAPRRSLITPSVLLLAHGSIAILSW